jgi:hypothetical protein
MFGFQGSEFLPTKNIVMPVNVKKINAERLAGWEKRLNEHHSTPIVLVGVGHDHVNARIFILCTEDRTDDEVILFLKETLRQLTGT